MVKRRLAALKRLAAVAVITGLSNGASAIDRPDAPDRMPAFSAEVNRLEAEMLDAGATAEFAAAGGRYQAFLGGQLNQILASLKRQLTPAEAEALVQSQQLWERFRDREQRFIDRDWAPSNFGSSYVLSRHHYRAQLSRDRIEQLLQYLSNYPRE